MLAAVVAFGGRRLVRFVSYYSRAISDVSGVTVALWLWASALVGAGQEVVVVHAGGDRRSPHSELHVQGVQDIAISHVGNNRPTYVPIGLRSVLRSGDVLLLHEGWVVGNHVAGAIARNARVPYVVVPHGVYEPGIVRSLKPPQAVRRTFERALLERSTGVHVFWDSERPLIRAVAPRARPIVAPIGATVPPEEWTGGGGYLAWLGRFDPVHKGLDLLLEALARLGPSERPRLRMHGSDYHGGLAVTRSHIERLGLGDWVTTAGPVYGDEKREFLIRSEGYVHPARWESYGLALIENLALGVPCVVSDAIHVAPELDAAHAAIVVPGTPDGIASGLRVLSSAAPNLKIRGRRFVHDRLAWPAVTNQFLRAIRDRLT